MQNKANDPEEIANRREGRIYAAHNLFVGGVTAIFTIAGIFAFISFSNLKDELRNEMELFKNNLKQEVINEVQSNIDEVSNQVQERVNAEFDRENIQLMVERTAKERLDKIADNLITSKIEYEIVPKLDETNIKIEKVFQETELKLIFLEASNDSRTAFEKLKELSKQSDYTLRLKANEYYMQLLDELKSPVYYYTFLVSGENLPDFSKMNIDQIKELMSISNNESRATILNEVWGISNLTFQEKMKFYNEVIKNDQSINVTRSAAQIVINQNKLDYNPMEWDKIISFIDKSF